MTRIDGNELGGKEITMSDLKGKAEMEKLQGQLAEAELELQKALRRAADSQAGMEAMRREIQRLSEHLAEALRRAEEAGRQLREQEERRREWFDRNFGRKATQAGLPEVYDEFDGSIRDHGWEEVYRRWVSKPAAPSVGRSQSGSGYTVIPGIGGACNETVVVFIDSGPYDRSLPHEPFFRRPRRRVDELETLKLHLVECQRVRRVMILSAWLEWDYFREEVLPWVQAWENRGVAFALAVVAPGGRQLVPVRLGS